MSGKGKETSPRDSFLKPRDTRMSGKKAIVPKSGAKDHMKDAQKSVRTSISEAGVIQQMLSEVAAKTTNMIITQKSIQESLKTESQARRRRDRNRCRDSCRMSTRT